MEDTEVSGHSLPRARDLGIPLEGTPGPWNSITDVPGVEVGYKTLIRGDAVRTGVTAVHPRGRAGAMIPCAVGYHCQNGNGELTGVSWLTESGFHAGPLAITSTHSIGAVHAGVVRWMLQEFPQRSQQWILPVVGETWDGWLNDANGEHVSEEDAVQALRNAATGPLLEGSVGGGTGAACYEYKGGTGTSSRLVKIGAQAYTVGILIQANFGRRPDLTITGVKVGRELGDDNPMADHFTTETGSAIVVVITDAPLLPHQCNAMARRVTVGLGRTGAFGSHSSGDLFIALSTGSAEGLVSCIDPSLSVNSWRLAEMRFLPWTAVNPLFEAVVQATEEATLNALTSNKTMVGFQGHRVPALPREQLISIFRRHGPA
jgi:D-aminopeptidase